MHKSRTEWKQKAAAAVFCVAVASRLLGQQKSSGASQTPLIPGTTTERGDQTPTLKIRVNQVLVPVVVTDKGGHNVEGLRAGDFVVFENGVEQKLSYFETQDERPPDLNPVVSFDPAKPGVESSPVPQGTGRPPLRRTYVVCLDTINSSFENFTYVRGALRKLFKKEQGEESLYAILTLGRSTSVVQNLTRDSGAMLAAVASRELTSAIQQSEATNMKHRENELGMMLSDYCQRCPCAGESAGGHDSACDGKLQAIEMWASSAASERSVLTRAFLQNLRHVVEGMGKTPGKRTLVFVSDGFNTHPGRDLFGLIASYTRNPSALMNGSINDAEPQIQDILRAACERDVAFYTLDSRGLSGPGGGAFDASEETQWSRTVLVLPEIQQQKQMMAMENQSPLAELAKSTGGVFFRNNNDLFKGMHQAFADGREYYLLAYVSTNPATDGKYREIKVNIKEKNLVVRAKRGYWAPTQ